MSGTAAPGPDRAVCALNRSPIRTTPGRPLDDGMTLVRSVLSETRVRIGGDDAVGMCDRGPMVDTAAAPGSADPPTDQVAWRSRLEESRATMDGLRQDTARVSVAIAATERAIASTLRKLAAEDRQRGRTAAADRREARAQDAERFAARESAAADVAAQRSSPDVDHS